jgi:hypothetical protein
MDRLLQDSPASFLESANSYLARANLKWSAMKDAPLEGLGWIHGFIPSSPLLFNRTVRRPELRKIVPFANTTIHEPGNAQNSPTLLSDVPMRRLRSGGGRGLD